MTKNQIDYWSLDETKRANRARETELNRHQLATEQLQREANQITLSLGNRNADINAAKQQEEVRSHKANEGLTAQQNYIKFGELGAKLEANRISEINADANTMNARANALNATTNARNADELNRSNLAQEQLKQQQIDESVRNNKEVNDLRRFEAVIGNQNKDQDRGVAQQNADTATFNATETKRNNLYNQALQAAGLEFEIQNKSAQTKSQIMRNAFQNGSDVVRSAKMENKGTKRRY